MMITGATEQANTQTFPISVDLFKQIGFAYTLYACTEHRRMQLWILLLVSVTDPIKLQDD